MEEEDRLRKIEMEEEDRQRKIKMEEEDERRKIEMEEEDKRRKIIMEKRIYLYISYNEKDEAKKLGAKWDSDIKKWYAPDTSYKELINKYNIY
jgi:hypothetical protein